MYNSVLLEETDIYMQCFLWRDLDPNTVRSTFQVLVNNIGVKLARALQKSAAMHKQEFPETAS